MDWKKYHVIHTFAIFITLAFKYMQRISQNEHCRKQWQLFWKYLYISSHSEVVVQRREKFDISLKEWKKKKKLIFFPFYLPEPSIKEPLKALIMDKLWINSQAV